MRSRNCHTSTFKRDSSTSNKNSSCRLPLVAPLFDPVAELLSPALLLALAAEPRNPAPLLDSAAELRTLAYRLIQLLNFELHVLWIGRNDAHLQNQLPSGSHLLQGVKSDLLSSCVAPHDIWISCSAMTWHGETGIPRLDIGTSCSATSWHGETTASVKLCDSNNRIVMALLISRMFLIIHSILFEICKVSFP